MPIFFRDNRRLTLIPLAESILRLELTWPFPLIAVGVAKSLDPLFVGVGLIFAFLPWVARLIVIGRLTRFALISDPLLLFTVAGLMGAAVAYDPALSWPMMLTLLGSINLFYAVVNTSVDGWWMAKGAVIGAALVAFYFVGQYGHFDYPLEFGRVVNLGRQTGNLLPSFVFFTPHPNAAAAFLEGVLFLNLILLWPGHPHPSKSRITVATILWGATFIFISYALLISRSRGSWVGLLAAVGIWGILSISNLKHRLMAGVLAIGGVTLAVFLVASILIKSQNRFLVSLLETSHSRFVLYRNSFYLLKDYIFTGVGLGEVFALVYSRYQLLIPVPFLTYTHNLFLAIGFGMGFLGLVALMWLLISYYQFVVRVEQIGDEPSTRTLFRATWLGVTVNFIHGLTDSPQFASPGWTMPMLFLLLGLTIAVGRPAYAETRRRQAGVTRLKWDRRRARLVLVGLIMLLSLGSLFWRPLLSAGYANLGAFYQTRADLAPNLGGDARADSSSRAAAYFERALILDPGNAVANRRLGILLLDRTDFEQAIIHLEPALQREPHNQATLKALGLAYLWTGALDRSEELLFRLDPLGDLINQLEGWRWWWRTQQRPELSRYADEMLQRLPSRTW